MKGDSASTRVRSPGRAGVYFPNASMLCRSAAPQAVGVSGPAGRERRAWRREFRKMEKRAPEVPSMAISTTGTMEARERRGSFVRG